MKWNKMNIKKHINHILFKNGRIIDPFNQKSFKGSIWVKDGRIAGVGDFEIPKVDDIFIIDCTRCIHAIRVGHERQPCFHD